MIITDILLFEHLFIGENLNKIFQYIFYYGYAFDLKQNLVKVNKKGNVQILGGWGTPGKFKH